jgi:LPXTG-site transpeptidase (sortase) family protein
MSWRGLVSFLGTLMVAVGLGGFALLSVAPKLPPAASAPIFAALGPPETLGAQEVPSAATKAPEHHSITRLSIPSIDLDTPVVQAELVERDGQRTWEVPKFVAGHAEGTSGPGEPGNAIIIGHVTSLTLGNVFEHLDGVQRGALIHVFSETTRFDYRVVDIRDVSRADVSVLDPEQKPTLSLITCSGLWLPTIWDYTQRLVVRAELIGDRADL